jgi:hypothetical protein
MGMTWPIILSASRAGTDVITLVARRHDDGELRAWRDSTPDLKQWLGYGKTHVRSSRLQHEPLPFGYSVEATYDRNAWRESCYFSDEVKASNNGSRLTEHRHVARKCNSVFETGLAVGALASAASAYSDVGLADLSNGLLRGGVHFCFAFDCRECCTQAELHPPLQLCRPLAQRFPSFRRAEIATESLVDRS